MPAAQFLIVERKAPNEFLLMWWDHSEARREELASREQLSRRCDVLTMPEGSDGAPYAALVGN